MAAARNETGFEFRFKSRVSLFFVDLTLSDDRAYVVTSVTTQVVECLESLAFMDMAYCHLFVSDVDRTLNYVMQDLLPRSVCVCARACACMYVCIIMYNMLTYAICCLRKCHMRIGCGSLITTVMPFLYMD
jgi:hypothetical protein